MRPLTVAHVDAERGFSGGEVQVFLLMEGLRRRGHRCVLFAPGGSRAADEARARDFPLRAAALRHDLDLISSARLARGFRAEGCDLVHLHTGRATWLGGIAAWRAGLPAVTTRRMDRPVRAGRKTRAIYERLTAGVAAISPAVDECLRAGGVRPERIRVIPDSVDPESVVPRLARNHVRAREGAQPEDVVALTMARLVHRKGLDVLLHALARSERPERLWIAGDGPQRAALEALSVELGLGRRVRFLGHRDDKGELLGACDLFVLPSRAEGMGVAALEAMAAGRALIASRVGGLAQVIVHDRTGLLVPPEDVAALAAALERLSADGALRAALGGAGPGRIVEGYLPEQMVDGYEALYESVLSAGARRYGA